MIEHGDLSRPCRITVEDGHHRPWHRAFRKTPKQRLVFVGVIDCYEWRSEGTTVTVVDAFQRLLRSSIA